MGNQAPKHTLAAQLVRPVIKEGCTRVAGRAERLRKDTWRKPTWVLEEEAGWECQVIRCWSSMDPGGTQQTLESDITPNCHGHFSSVIGIIQPLIVGS